MEDGATIVLQKAERCQVAKDLYWGGGRLESEADRLALDLALRLSRDADLFLDVGAYTGLFALAVARLNPRVHCDAYEIVPENYLLMWENTIHNNLVERVHPKLLGLGAARSTLKVPSSLGAGVLASSVALDSVAADGTDIPVAPLDDVYAGFDGRMVMKIDVEGFEWEVFRGGRELVARVKPDIVCEVLRRAPNVPEMREFLLTMGYHIFHITAEGLRPATQIVPVKHERDWLFTTRSAEALQALAFTVLPPVH
jgi:FkbM family methyltransferase